MKIIESMLPIIRKLLPDQPEAGTWRLMHFVIRVPVKDGVLYHHNMTKETLLLTAEEDGAVQSGQYPEEIKTLFLADYYLVPENHDDCRLCDELRDFLRMAQAREWAGKLNSFTILPTTDCNARCFYCYEKGCKKENMTEQTALDVADFILRRGNEKHIELHWFGGEPLYNSGVIDTICEYLSKNGREYHSRMISNGYLFDDAMIEKAVSFWKLKTIQITLDGLEDTYNRTKAYIYGNAESPFRRVTDNILRLMDAGVLVHIRLNMSENNGEELRELAAYIREKAGKRTGLDVYVSPLYQLSDELDRDLTLQKQLREIKSAIHPEISSGEGAYDRSVKYRGTINICHCMADNPAAVVILPDGSLTKCEHFVDGPSCGSIYDDAADRTALEYWSTYAPRDVLCNECPGYPGCATRLLHCSGYRPCSEYLKKNTILPLIDMLKNRYSDGLQRIQTV